MKGGRLCWRTKSRSAKENPEAPQSTSVCVSSLRRESLTVQSKMTCEPPKLDPGISLPIAKLDTRTTGRRSTTSGETKETEGVMDEEGDKAGGTREQGKDERDGGCPTKAPTFDRRATSFPPVEEWRWRRHPRLDRLRRRCPECWWQLHEGPLPGRTVPDGGSWRECGPAIRT